MIKVVHCNKESYDILIDRTTMWGNPFEIGRDGSRSEVIDKFRKWLNGEAYTDFKQKEREAILFNLDVLENKTLACWCKPKACHGDVYRDMVEERKTGILKM